MPSITTGSRDQSQATDNGTFWRSSSSDALILDSSSLSVSHLTMVPRPLCDVEPESRLRGVLCLVRRSVPHHHEPFRGEPVPQSTVTTVSLGSDLGAERLVTIWKTFFNLCLTAPQAAHKIWVD